jgi:hypothetical protein
LTEEYKNRGLKTMKIDLAAFDLKTMASVRSAALACIAFASKMESLHGAEKFTLVVKTLREAIESAPLDPAQKTEALNWIDVVLPHVVEAALFVMPMVAPIVAEVRSFCSRSCRK